MRKIPSLFCRNYDGDRLVRDEVAPGCEWVLAGEGTPTRKHDGTACLVRDGQLFKRHDMKAKRILQGKQPPKGWKPCEPTPDAHSGHWPGWLPVGDGPEDQWHREAWERDSSLYGAGSGWLSGTYELCGPKIGSAARNSEGLDGHWLIRHGVDVLTKFMPTQRLTFESVRDFLTEMVMEGVVWYHPDGRMVKIKRRDFGISWPDIAGPE